MAFPLTNFSGSSRSPPLFGCQGASALCRFSSSRLLAAGGLRADLSLYQAEQKSVKVGPGADLLSHAVAHAVSSALERFTTVFGMGTGGTTPPAPPGPALTLPSLSASRTHHPQRLGWGDAHARTSLLAAA